MAGYSGTPLPRKLGIKEGHAVAIIDAPEGFGDTLGELPPGVAVRPALKAGDVFDVVDTWSGLRLVYRVADCAAVVANKKVTAPAKARVKRSR